MPRFRPAFLRVPLAAALVLPLVTFAPAIANELALPRAGDHALRVLSPTVLELGIVTEHGAPDQPLAGLVGENFVLHAPPPATFTVTADGAPSAVKSVGFKRRVLYAPLTQRDLRVGNWLYLELAQPLPPNAAIEVTLREGRAGTPSAPQRAAHASVAPNSASAATRGGDGAPPSISNSPAALEGDAPSSPRTSQIISGESNEPRDASRANSTIQRAAEGTFRSSEALAMAERPDVTASAATRGGDGAPPSISHSPATLEGDAPSSPRTSPGVPDGPNGPAPPALPRQANDAKPHSPSPVLWPADWKFAARTDPLRDSPVIHVSQVGYAPSLPKIAMVGYYLGSLGELAVPSAEFTLRDTLTNRVAFRGALTRRPDQGSSVTPPPYREVLQADFSEVRTPGEYRLVVDGLGASLPFRIHDGAALAVARAYALGLYHQRCGAANALPFTRHTHAACHLAPAEVPLSAEKFPFTWKLIGELAAEERSDASKPPQPFTASETSQLYPFVNAGPLDVAGGHHDAGDYSKYTANSAALVHTLVFGVDALPGVAALDNLGLPESGDGIPDLLQEAKWEADFLAKLQDDDGGFYFLVYPRDRRYESNALPDAGEPQVVWPKNTAVTAAAVAALAQCASSPQFKKHFPQDAARYLAQAMRGWEFLRRALEGGAPSPPQNTNDDRTSGADGAAPSTRAVRGGEGAEPATPTVRGAEAIPATFAVRGADGAAPSASAGRGSDRAALSTAARATGLAAYQRLTHYGDNYTHDDELAWAAAELFLATGEPEFQRALFRALPEPGRVSLRRWGWWRLSEGWGNAIRSYAFATRSGRLTRAQLDEPYLRLCEGELLSAADDALARSRASAYGTAFPLETKRHRNAGWYFSLDSAMDLAVGAQVLATNAGLPAVEAWLTDPAEGAPAPVRGSKGEGDSRLRQDGRNYVAALVGNLNFETGTNPLNVPFITGLGRTRQREIVHQFSHNDRRALPPSGIPIGNLQAGQPYHAPSQLPLRLLSFPDDGAASDPYAFYDRWSDVHNVSTEFVVTNQARGLVSAAFLAALTSAKDQPWRAAEAKIVLSNENPEVGERVTARLKMAGTRGRAGPPGPPQPIRGDDGASPSTRDSTSVMDGDAPSSPRRSPHASGGPVLPFSPEALELAEADLIWEARDHAPQRGAEFAFMPRRGGAQWIEAEATWPDGRRVFAAAEFKAASSQTTWIDDAWPDGAQSHAGAAAWIGDGPSAFSGTKAHTSAATVTGGAAGIHEHGFDYAADTLEIESGDMLFTHVWLDPQSPPRQIMIAWNDGSWEHRAYWGANAITYGADGGAGRKRIGDLPEKGKWVRLDVPARAVDLGGKKVRGMSFSAVDGRAVWDLSGRRAAKK